MIEAKDATPPGPQDPASFLEILAIGTVIGKPGPCVVLVKEKGKHRKVGAVVYVGLTMADCRLWARAQFPEALIVERDP